MSESQTPWNTVGERIRQLRSAAGLTVRELARRIGVSASHVSQVERGIGSFSVPALYAVAAELGVQMHVLLDPDAPVPPAAVPEPWEDGGDLVSAGIVQRGGEHPTIKLSSGPQWSRLTAVGEADAEFLEVIYAPGTEAPAEHIVHQGREYGVIIEGELSVEVHGQATTLVPGDSIVFDSALPHRFWNAGDVRVRAIWFVRDRHAIDPVPHA
ncbi:cupin domain-containing protein [Microbacterium sp. TNHR37B]|uniref:cupin domain-containing protein n=1 Tax=Microbacterium sp. TNHR37B TaxID=1775956 RepID=UPI0007B29B34|nr:cupin domain-containing protein [Microbacterium sp. TNHR37B]KZE91636.1 HTH-type transcriptional regulator PuuR [Microbacterium sp. TNHR37B]